ncbi:MAG: twin-arginine translocation signal domain-containing protein [Nitrospirae bacterium]|nr:twin-arginine translocation signal domain-containing protein [Nitrospirota bacterium]
MKRIITRRDFLRTSAIFAGGIGMGSFWTGASMPYGNIAHAAILENVKETEKLIGDVVDFALSSDKWKGRFGFVTLEIHGGYFEGDKAYFIRSEASDKDYARANGLIFSPRISLALDGEEMLGEKAYADFYHIEGQWPVLSSIPGRADYTPAWRIFRVSKKRDAGILKSVRSLKEAEGKGDISIRPTNIIVNFPLVKWPGGELPRDTRLEEYLGEGQLIEPVNTEKMQVTFKLHECFPSERYIVTDASLEGPSKMMNVAYSPKASLLREVDAAAKILVFVNGIKGTGPMGFQPSIVDNPPRHRNWSGFWDHYAFKWTDSSSPRLLFNHSQILSTESKGLVQRFTGSPMTHPVGFVVNCPVPVRAPRTFKG